MKILKFLGGLFLVVLLIAGAALAWAFYTANAKYTKMWTAHDATFPVPFPLDSLGLAELAAERIAAGAPAKDPLAGVDLEAAAMERAVKNGHHLVHSRLACNGCHGEDFGGSVVIDVPPVGYWAAPNLTAGQGSITNGFGPHDWDLAVRHGIRHTGMSSSMPCNEFKGVTDHELSDVIAYLKTQKPVDRLIKPVRLGPVFAFLTATDPTMLPAQTIDHQAAHAVEPPSTAVTLEFGRHIVPACEGCHNPKLSGGKMQGDPNMPIVANITLDETGLKSWSEADFIRAMREGKRPDGSDIKKQMPWEAFRKMTDTELKALWLYLQSVPPLPKGAK